MSIFGFSELDSPLEQSFCQSGSDLGLPCSQRINLPFGLIIGLHKRMRVVTLVTISIS
jgi:hypothetical protein